MRFKASLVVLVAAGILTACGGGAGSSIPSSPAGSSGVTPQAKVLGTQAIQGQVIDAANGLGTPLKAATDFERDTSGVSPAMLTPGQCSNGVEFTYPAPPVGKATPDPDSTQMQYFYDSACTQLARSILRQYNNPSGGGSETVYRTVKQYYQGSSSVVAVVTDTVQLTNGVYDQYGFPIPSAGYVRTATGELDMAATKVFAIDTEQVIEPVQGRTGGGGGATEIYCGDTAGYNATGDFSNGMTYGWSGGVLNGGTRTVNSDGSVTYQGTHMNVPTAGQIGSLVFSYGNPSTQCPINTPPLFTVTGGTTWGTASFPTTIDFLHGEITGLTVTGGKLANGNLLAVSSSGSPTSPNFITGTISSAKGATVLGTFTLNCFGDGTLSMTSGATFTILDWHVK